MFVRVALTIPVTAEKQSFTRPGLNGNRYDRREDGVCQGTPPSEYPLIKRGHSNDKMG
jgi:hypothetical protein